MMPTVSAATLSKFDPTHFFQARGPQVSHAFFGFNWTKFSFARINFPSRSSCTASLFASFQSVCRRNSTMRSGAKRTRSITEYVDIPVIDTSTAVLWNLGYTPSIECSPHIASAFRKVPCKGMLQACLLCVKLLFHSACWKNE